MKHHFCSSSIFNLFQLNTYNRFLVVVHELYGFLRYLESLFNARKYQLFSRILLLTCCRSQNRFENFYVKYSTQIKFAAPMKKFEVIEDLAFLSSHLRI